VHLLRSAAPGAALTLACALAAAEPARRTRPIAADYEVTAGPGARELHVEAAFDAPGDVLALQEGLGAFLTEGRIAREGEWVRAETRGDTLLVPGCRAGPCRVRYTVRLADAALALRDRNRALYHTGAVLAPPSTWLARPVQPPRPGDRYRFHMRMPRGSAFVTGVMPAAGEGRYEGRLEDLPLAPYSAFGPLEVTRLRAAGGALEVALAPGQRALSREAILDWVERAAAAVAAVYGRLPVPRVAVLVLPGSRRAVGFGSTLGHGGASIVVWLGAQAREEDLRRDWVLTHEMAHLGLPNLPRDQRWLEEGLATYLEPVARARAGQISAEEAWAGLVAGLPKGLPRDGDGGLDGTRSWGRTYWGGALFYLLADLEIRERTGNRRSLDDALRGIVAAGGTIAVRWPVARALEAGDRSAGVDVLRRLHARLGATRDEVDLDALWARLGVRQQAGAIHFDDAAPLAAIRRSLTDARRPSATADAGR
jgi:predicted metalloprotease with PDZ domain